jgi:hypothetical protein
MQVPRSINMPMLLFVARVSLLAHTCTAINAALLNNDAGENQRASYMCSSSTVSSVNSATNLW